MKLSIIGTGLMGGSAALAMRRGGLVDSICACDLNPATVRDAVELGIAEEGTTNPVEAARGADVVIVATPVLTMESIFRRIAPVLGSSAVVTDIGSVRGVVQEGAKRALGAKFARYAPCHPIAGAEKVGVRYAFDSMFEGKKVMSTADLGADADAVDLMEELWRSTGATVVRMTAARHDEVFAMMSHIPHVLAFAFVAMITESRDPDTLLSQGGSGFLDFSRIAASSPVMWKDICLANRREVARGLRGYIGELQRFLSEIEEGDADRLVANFARAAEARRNLGQGRTLKPQPSKGKE